jgi:hypothetical protein
MINRIYVLGVGAVVGIFLVFLFIINTQTSNVSPSTRSASARYVKISDNIVDMPLHVLEGILAQYRNRIIRLSHKDVDVDLSQLDRVKNELSRHVFIKYGIQYDLNPTQLENYILDLGIRSSNSYDDELVGGVDISGPARTLGIIVWYIEQICILNRNNTDAIEVPLVLEHMEKLMSDVTPTSVKSDPYIWMAHDKSAYDAKDYLEGARDVPIAPLYGVTDVVDPKEQWRIPVGGKPKPCSRKLRTNLHDYLSDAAATDVHAVSMGAGNVYYKAQNTKEAIAGWNGAHDLSRNVDTSHLNEDDFDMNDNRWRGPYMQFAEYRLALDAMRDDRLNNKNRFDSETQSLTDNWDFLERNFMQV